eukprot:m51a1_g8885 putative s-adenosyl-methionine-sterol-c- methyltransferas (347) ;mRNA; f:658403-659833
MATLARSWRAFMAVYRMPEEQVRHFFESYELFDQEAVTAETTSKIVDYYSLLNQLCSLGDVEKMYIPPVIDDTKGIAENQTLFERQFALKDIDLQPGDRVLDVGCGRGRIAAHVASMLDGVHVSGINLDPSQIANARENAVSLGLAERLDFTIGDYNEPLPWPDAAFDGAYNVQALTYVRDGDLRPLCRELFRVLKPGARFSTTDWVKLPAYDEANADHRQLMRRCKALIGAVNTPRPEDFENALRGAGFVVEYSGIPSKDGLQAGLVLRACSHYQLVSKMVHGCVAVRLLPQHFAQLLDRFNQDGDSLVKGDEMRLWTTVYQVVARKPGPEDQHEHQSSPHPAQS